MFQTSGTSFLGIVNLNTPVFKINAENEVPGIQSPHCFES